LNPASGLAVCLPEPRSLFARRARRLRVLAAATPNLSGYLSLLATLAERQAELAQQLETGAMTDPTGPAAGAQAGEGQAPLFRGKSQAAGERNAAANWRQPPLYLEVAGTAAVLGSLIKQIIHDFPAPSPAVAAALERLDAVDAATIAHWLEGLMSAAPNTDDVAVLPFVAAALQALLAQRASRLDVASVTRPGESRRCPICGGWPLASIRRTVAETPGLRYLHCAFCASEWMHPRIQCVQCGSGEQLAYYGIEGSGAAVQAESCDACRTYLKRIDRDQSPDADPCADDLATLGLDVLMNEQGYQRLGANLWLQPVMDGLEAYD